MRGDTWWQWAYDALEKEHSISSVLDRTSVDMDAPMSRYEMGDVLQQTLSLDSNKPYAQGFFDLKSNENGASAAVANGLLTGYPYGVYLGDQSLTRAEGLTVLSRVINHVSREEDVVFATGNILLTQQFDGDTITLRTRDLNSDALLDSFVASTAAYRQHEEIQSDDRILSMCSVVNANAEYFWGWAGMYAYDAAGSITQIASNMVIDYSYNELDGSIAIIAHDGSGELLMAGTPTYEVYGNQVFRIASDGTQNIVIGNNPVHNIAFTNVWIMEGNITLVSSWVESHSVVPRASYQMENGKLRVTTVLQVFEQMYGNEQAYLDSIGIGVGAQ